MTWKVCHMTFFGRLWKISVFLNSPEFSLMKCSTMRTVWSVGERANWFFSLYDFCSCFCMTVISIDII